MTSAQGPTEPSGTATERDPLAIPWGGAAADHRQRPLRGTDNFPFFAEAEAEAEAMNVSGECLCLS